MNAADRRRCARCGDWMLKIGGPLCSGCKYWAEQSVKATGQKALKLLSVLEYGKKKATTIK